MALFQVLSFFVGNINNQLNSPQKTVLYTTQIVSCYFVKYPIINPLKNLKSN